MTVDGKIYRVFTCPRCNYTGYREVSNRDEDCACNLCTARISHTPEMKYVDSVEDALQVMQMIVLRAQRRSKPELRLGLGVKRRVLNMVADLSDLNHGRGVSIDRVLQECRDAGINLQKAQNFLEQLEEEGLIMDMDGTLRAVEEDDDW